MFVSEPVSTKKVYLLSLNVKLIKGLFDFEAILQNLPHYQRDLH